MSKQPPLDAEKRQLRSLVRRYRRLSFEGLIKGLDQWHQAICQFMAEITARRYREVVRRGVAALFEQEQP